MAEIPLAPEKTRSHPSQKGDIVAVVREWMSEYRRDLTAAREEGKITDEVYRAKLALLDRMGERYSDRRDLLSDAVRDGRDTILSATQEAIVREHEYGRIDTEQLLGRYIVAVNDLRERLRGYRSARDADAQFIRTLADDLVWFVWGDTERSRHERAYAAIKSESSGALSSLERVLSSRKMTSEQLGSYEYIHWLLRDDMSTLLGEVNPLLSLGNSLHAMGEGNKHLIHAGADMLGEAVRRATQYDRIRVGAVTGTIRGVGDVLSGVTDLTAFAFRFFGSSQYREKIAGICEGVAEYVQKNGIPWETAQKTLSDAFERVLALPPEKQADALARIATNIAGMFALAGIAQWAGRVGSGAEMLGEGVVLASTAERWALLVKIGTFVLNGPAESLLGAACGHSFRILSSTLRGGASATHKLAEIERTIRELDAAISSETNPERLTALRDARSACQSERGKFIDVGEFARVEWYAETGVLHVKNVLGKTSAEIEQNITHILSRYEPKQIEFSTEIPSEVRRAFADMLARNHPMMEILRLVPGHDVVNVNFRGTKDFNTLFGAAAYDDFLATFKSVVRRRMEARGHAAGNSRITQSSYKNMTISDPDGLKFIREVFWSDDAARKTLVDEAIVAHRDAIERLAAAKGVNPDAVAEKMRKTFDFSLGRAHVASDKPEDLVRAFYEAEMRSRGISPRPGETFEQAQRRIAGESFAAERSFSEFFSWKKFTADGREYPMTLRLPTGEDIIHPVLLRLVRKGEVEWLESAAVAGVKKYIDTLNNGFDFIAPFRNLERDFAHAQEMDRAFRAGRIDTEHLLKNHKGTYTREALAALAEWKEGIKVFVDIIDMGIMNLASFRNLAKRVFRGEASFRDLISAGGDVTDQFARFVREIERVYPEAKLSLGGDEVFIFIPGKTPAETSAILSEIGRALSATNLRGRMAHSFETWDVRSVFYRLDTQTKVNKAIEKILPDGLATHVSLPEGLWVAQAVEILKDTKIPDFLAKLSGVARCIRLGAHELVGSISETGVYQLEFVR